MLCHESGVGRGVPPVTWTQYRLQTTLHTMGQLPCCRTKGCRRSRVIPLGDGTKKDESLCESPVLSFQRPVGRCMSMIRPADVIRVIEGFYEGGTLSRDQGPARQATEQAA